MAASERHMSAAPQYDTLAGHLPSASRLGGGQLLSAFSHFRLHTDKNSLERLVPT